MLDKIKTYHIDAFTNKVFGGNPAVVIPLDYWLSEDIMQNIAAENNLSETAFFVKNENVFEIRWFTPTVEIELCGHATLASAFVIFNYLNYNDSIIYFNCMVGELVVKRIENNFICLNFPSDKGKVIEDKFLFENILCTDALSVYEGKTKYLVELNGEEDIVNFSPDFNEIKKLDKQLIITSKGKEVDFVSRFFAPNHGIDEDPVTGSAHCVLIPFWAKKLNKTKMTAYQLSKRKGYLICEYLESRVEMSGQAVCYSIGEVQLEF